jgi:hypothetical protein
LARNKTVGYSPTPSPTRSRWITLGLGLLIAAVLGGVFVLGRLSTPHADAATAAASGLAMRSGVPVPDRHSAAGAATAAQNFQIAGFRVSSGTLDPAVAAEVLLAADADPSAARVLTAPTTDPAQLAQTRTTYAALSTVVVSYTPQEATVQVWGVSATSSQVTPTPGGTQTWGRANVTLVWDGTQWRVVAQQYSPGPWPVRADQRLAESTGDFAFRFSELRQHGWTYVPEP